MKRRVLNRTAGRSCRRDLVAVACPRVPQRRGSAGRGEAEPAVAAKTIVVTPQSFTETLGAIGTVTPRTGHVATLSAPAAGRVGAGSRRDGPRRPRRAIRSSSWISRRSAATLQSAEAAFTVAEQANERQQRLAKEGIVPRKDAEQAAAELARARADVDHGAPAEQLSIIRVADRRRRHTDARPRSAPPSIPRSRWSKSPIPRALDILLSVTPTDAARVHPGAKTSLTPGSPRPASRSASAG